MEWQGDDKGNYLIDGTIDPKSVRPRYGTAELYIDRPGFESTRRVTRKKLVLQASNFIMNDERIINAIKAKLIRSFYRNLNKSISINLLNT